MGEGELEGRPPFHDPEVEAVEGGGGVKNLSWLAQVTVLLPAELTGAGDVTVSVTVRGVESNKVTLRVTAVVPSYSSTRGFTIRPRSRNVRVIGVPGYGVGCWMYGQST